MSQSAPPRSPPRPRPVRRLWEWSRFAIGLCAFGLVASAAVAAAWTVIIPLFTDQFPTVIVSGSMSPDIKRGDVALIKPSDGTGLGPPTVILFSTPGLDTFHRIYRANPDGTYMTKGDANGSPDSELVRPEQVKGVGRLLVPFVAIALVWAREGHWLLVGLFVIGATLAICVCPWGVSDRYDPWLLAEARRPAGHPTRVTGDSTGGRGGDGRHVAVTSPPAQPTTL